jgi:DNA-binding NtrC family response regulator
MTTTESFTWARARMPETPSTSLPRRETAPPDPERVVADEPAESLLSAEQRKSVKVLIVDDEDTILDSSVSILEHEGYAVRGVYRGTEADACLREGTADIVLIDLYMTGVSGMQLLRTALEARPDTIVILITGRPSVESSVQALRDGAWDYLPKPFSASQLRVLVGRAAHTVIVSRESQAGATVVGPSGSGDDFVLLGDSPAFRAVVALARRVAPTDASVFITGESGTGKELVAQFIHRMSRRKSREMVAVNCAALPEPLLESEMFGHVKGAFTGATRDKSGLMEVANGGTLFLDELTEMSPMTQAKLLRVVQDGVVRRVGSSKTDAVVNVRFISATNKDPDTAVADGRLREDLYYRLGVVPIQIPPLRERLEDIPIVARYFLQAYWVRHGRGAQAAPDLSDEAVRALQMRPWKGNVRELQNVIEHAIVLAEGRDVIDAVDLPQLGGSAAGDFMTQGGFVGAGTTTGSYHETRNRVIARFEKEYLTWILHETDGNVSEAARVAGINRATLYRLLERHGLTKRDLLD